MSAAGGLPLSDDEYLALEAATGLRHRYVDGVADAMAVSDPELDSTRVREVAARGASRARR